MKSKRKRPRAKNVISSLLTSLQPNSMAHSVKITEIYSHHNFSAEIPWNQQFYKYIKAVWWIHGIFSNETFQASWFVFFSHCDIQNTLDGFFAGWRRFCPQFFWKNADMAIFCTNSKEIGPFLKQKKVMKIYLVHAF